MLIAGGEFSASGGSEVDNIAQWNGTAWGPLGAGLNGYVSALATYNGGLVAGGQFSLSGNQPVNRIARWDGNSWLPLGAGLPELAGNENAWVGDLIEYDGDLIAAGRFAYAGSTWAQSIARWDGSTWYPLGHIGLSCFVAALAVYNGDLYAGGYIESGVDRGRGVIARWDGAAWNVVGGGVDGPVNDLLVSDGELIVAGSFRMAGGSWADRVVAWNGTSWRSLAYPGPGGGSSVENVFVYALQRFEGNLYAGGHFGASSSSDCNNIARLRGGQWEPVGDGTGDDVGSLATYGGHLIAGGRFMSAWGVQASHVAQWGVCASEGDAPPAFDLSGPVNGSWTAAVPVFRWSGTLPAHSFELFVDGTFRGAIWARGQMNLDQPLSEGLHTWTVQEFGNCTQGRQANQTWSVRVDATPPTIPPLLSPAEGTLTNDRRPTFSWVGANDTGSGIDHYSVECVGAQTTTATSYEWPTNLADGEHVWTVRGVDAVGNIGESETARRIIIDGSAPTTPQGIQPASGACVGTALPVFVWSASTDGGSGIGFYQLVVDGAVVVDSMPVGTTTVQMPASSPLSEGLHNWYARAFDQAGNPSYTSSTSFSVDLTPPVTFTLASPANGFCVELPTPTFSWSPATDTGCGVDHYELWIDEALSVDNLHGTSSAPGQPLGAGSHTWTVRAVDRGGNGRSVAPMFTVNYDSVLPSAFTLRSPTSGARVPTARPILCWNPSQDAGSGIVRYELWVDGAVSAADVPGDTTCARCPVLLENGQHTWFVKAFDACGGTASSPIWEFVSERDVIPPQTAITCPVCVGGTEFSLTGTASDNAGGSGVTRVEVSVDGGITWGEAQATSPEFADWSYGWTGFMPGSHTVKSRATDAEGNVQATPAVCTATVDLTRPQVASAIVDPAYARAGSATVELHFSSGPNGLETLAPPEVRVFPASGDSIIVNQTSYSGTTWRGSLTVPGAAANGSARVAVWRVRDRCGNTSEANEQATSFVIDTVEPLAFGLVSPADSAGTASAYPALSWGTATDATSGIASYTLYVDGGVDRRDLGPSTTSSPTQHPLATGAHIWHIGAVDRAGNERETVDRVLFVDTIIPVVTITAPHPSEMIGLEYEVRGSASDIGSAVDRVEISTDAGARWSPAVNTGDHFSTWSYAWTDPPAGPFTMQARAVDRAGNLSALAAVSGTVNRARPEVEQVESLPAAVRAGSWLVRIRFVSNAPSMDESALPEVSYQVSGQPEHGIERISWGDNVWEGRFSVAETDANGQARLRIEGARNVYGNSMLPDSSHVFAVDTQPPRLLSALTHPRFTTPDQTTELIIDLEEQTSGLDPAMLPTVVVRSPLGTAIPVASTGYEAAAGRWTGSFQIPSGEASGSYRVEVQNARDRAGNAMEPSALEGRVIVDLDSPEAFALVSPADSAWTSSANPWLCWRPSRDLLSGLQEYALRINGEEDHAGIPPADSCARTAAPLSDGAYLWHVAARDSAGNQQLSSATFFLHKDGSAPTSSLLEVDAGDTLEATGSVLAEASDGVGASRGIGVRDVRLSLDGGATWRPMVPDGGGAGWRGTWSDELFGPRTLKTQAVDSLGNEEIPGPGTAVHIRGYGSIPGLRLSVFQNEVLTPFVEVICTADQELFAAPALTVTEGGSPAVLEPVLLAPQTWRARHQFTAVGPATIAARAVSATGRPGETSRSFGVNKCAQGTGTAIRDAQDHVVAVLPEGALSTDAWILASWEAAPEATTWATDGRPVQILSDRLVLGPDPLDFERPVSIELREEGAKGRAEPDGIYRLQDGRWVFTGGVRMDTDHWSASIRRTGSFALGRGAPGPPEVETRSQVLPPSPNPMTGTTRLELRSTTVTPYTARIFDLNGRLLREDHGIPGAAGAGEFIWNGQDQQGRPCPSGAYFIRLAWEQRTVTHTVTLIR
jgi:hypothetical protein